MIRQRRNFNVDVCRWNRSNIENFVNEFFKGWNRVSEKSCRGKKEKQEKIERKETERGTEKRRYSFVWKSNEIDNSSFFQLLKRWEITIFIAYNMILVTFSTLHGSNISKWFFLTLNLWIFKQSVHSRHWGHDEGISSCSGRNRQRTWSPSTRGGDSRGLQEQHFKRVTIPVFKGTAMSSLISQVKVCKQIWLSRGEISTLSCDLWCNWVATC